MSNTGQELGVKRLQNRNVHMYDFLRLLIKVTVDCPVEPLIYDKILLVVYIQSSSVA
jgi:hypothetical protein